MKRVLFTAVAMAAFGTVAAQAADLGRRPAAAPAYVETAPMMWNGFYIGGHVGYGWGRTTGSFAGTPFAEAIKSDGVFGGGQIGYNLQVSPNWVFGVEADISAGDIAGTQAIDGFRTKTDLLGTVRGRVGYAFNNVLIYGTGGFAWSQNRISDTILGGSATRDLTGFAAGGGVEYAFSPNWSAKVEYMYYDFGRQNYVGTMDPTVTPVTGRLDIHTVKFGVNYRFNWGGPVVARY